MDGVTLWIVPLKLKSGADGSTSPEGVNINPVPTLFSITQVFLSASAALIIYLFEVVIWLFVMVIFDGYLVLDDFIRYTPIPLWETIVFLSTTIPDCLPCW